MKPTKGLPTREAGSPGPKARVRGYEWPDRWALPVLCCHTGPRGCDLPHPHLLRAQLPGSYLCARPAEESRGIRPWATMTWQRRGGGGLTWPAMGGVPGRAPWNSSSTLNPATSDCLRWLPGPSGRPGTLCANMNPRSGLPAGRVVRP